MVTYYFYIKYNNIIYNLIFIKKPLKNYIAYLKNLTKKIAWIIEKHNWKRQKLRIQILISVVKIKY